ncbi:MAG: OmpA family protein [Cognatishimia sp.]|uniref:OmpA family protein n=1 Tax=Cognatishimia sp. TaxID=2211648 RepID=UPI003B8D8DF9
MVSKRLVISTVCAVCVSGAVTAQTLEFDSIPSVMPGHPGGVIGESHIFFPQGGTDIDQLGKMQIKLLGELLNGETLGTACIQLIGHSDTGGQRQTNQRISLKRAQVVKESLSRVLDSGARIQNVSAKGESAPLPAKSPGSKWQRRVEIRAARCS